MDYMEKLVKNLNLNEVQEFVLYGYGECLVNDREMFGDVLENELDRFVEDTFGIKVPSNQLGW